jgi:CMP-N-acetylneuraminic acid synthetase
MPVPRIAIVPARGNSKGIPGKNLHPVAGRPLLSYTLGPALQCGLFERVVVSSESPDILAYASSQGAEPLRRPDALSRDDVHSVHVVLNALESLSLPDESVVVMLLPTSPLRQAEDIAGAVSLFEATNADSVVSVCTDPHHLLHFREIDGEGLLRSVVDADPNVQRQDMPPLYVLNGSIYVSRAATLRALGSFHRGRVAPFVMDRRRSIDVDRPDDIADVELRLVS